MAEKGGDAIEENNTVKEGEEKLIANGGRAEREDPETFCNFLYNKKKGTVLGRTAKSWLQITVFYIIFYLCLAAFWIACLSIFLSTLDEKVPRFYGKGTIIGINPGLGYQPWLKENPDSTAIQFNTKDPESYKPYVDQLTEYLKKYENTNNTRECGPGETNADLFHGKIDKPCRFKLDAFAKDCNKASDYGYKIGKPCVVLSLNRLIGWQPVDYPSNSVPEQVRDRYKNGSIVLHCDGTNLPDKEHIGKVQYLPSEGIDGKYYPYSFMDNYHQPIAMVKFNSIPKNQIVLVECRAFALNIEQDITARLGLVHFELFIRDHK